MDITRKFLGQESYTGSLDFDDVAALDSGGVVYASQDVHVRGCASRSRSPADAALSEGTPPPDDGEEGGGQPPLVQIDGVIDGVIERLDRAGGTCTVRLANGTAVEVARDQVAAKAGTPYFGAELPPNFRPVFQKMQFGRAMYFLCTSDEGESDLLPPGWVEIVCPASGIRYFRNTLTDERMWQDPRPKHRRPVYLPDPRPLFQPEPEAPSERRVTAEGREPGDIDDVRRGGGCFAASSSGQKLAKKARRTTTAQQDDSQEHEQALELSIRLDDVVVEGAMPALASGPLACLPIEIFEAALGLLDPRSLSRASCVCKQWNKIISRADATLWKQQWSGFGWVLECGIWKQPGTSFGLPTTNASPSIEDEVRIHGRGDCDWEPNPERESHKDANGRGTT